MRILHIVSSWKGGVSRVAFDISEELIRRGHAVTIYATNLLRENADLCGKKISTIANFNVLFSPIAKKMKLFVTPQLILTLKEIKHFDIIHFHGYRTFQNIILHHYAKKCNVPYVLQVHGSLPRIMAWRRLKLVYDVLFGYGLLRGASKVVALSGVEAEQYRAMGVPEEKIAIIPNGIDLSEYAKLPPKGTFKKKFGIPEEEKVVLYLGRIHKIKGLDILVKAFADIVKKLNDVKLVIAGLDDGYLNKLKALIKALKIEKNVLVTGPLYGRDKVVAFVDADVCVLPSRYETFPMTVLEAVACGTPVILTENCGAAEYFKDRVGLIVKCNSDYLGQALLELLLSHDTHHVFKENCKTVTKEFDISKVVLKLEKVYGEVVDN